MSSTFVDLLRSTLRSILILWHHSNDVHVKEIYDIIQKVTALRKPIFSFDVTNHCENEGDSHCFHVEDIDDMIAVIQEYLAQLS